MRKLLILAAGATLLAAPVFAQTTNTPPDATQGQTPAMPSGGQTTNSGDIGAMPGSASPTATPPASGAGPDTSMPSGGMQNGMTAAPNSSMNTGTPPTRMYSATGGNGDVQVVSNGPVPDTAANRAKYKPLSHAGRRSKSAGD